MIVFYLTIIDYISVPSKINTMYKIMLSGLVITGLFFSSCNSASTSDTTDTTTSKTVTDSASEVVFKDYGAEPTVLDIDAYTKQNESFRHVLWTGAKMQVTLMSIPVGEEIGLEMHTGMDQFLRVEEGSGKVYIGDSKDSLNYQQDIEDDDAIMVPGGKWHNIVNMGAAPLKLYSIYSPVEHPKGAVHKTKAEAVAAEAEHHH